MDADLKNDDELPEDISGALKRLDDDAARRAASVDPARVVARVLRRLQDEPVVTVVTPIRPRLRMPAAVRVAAAVAVLVTGGMVARQVIGARGAAPGTTDVSWLAVPESLDASQASALLAAVDSVHASVDSVLPAAGVTVEDLNEQELQALLLTMDQEGSL